MSARVRAALLAAAVVAVVSTVAVAQSPSTMDSQMPESGASPGPMSIPHLPHITLQALPSYGPAPLTVGFLLQNADPDTGTLASYNWNLGDGTVSSLPPTVLFHTYVKPGSYVVTVTATTTMGLSASGFAGVVVRPAATQ